MHCLKLMYGFFTFISQGKEKGAKTEKNLSSISVFWCWFFFSFCKEVILRLAQELEVMSIGCYCSLGFHQGI